MKSKKNVVIAQFSLLMAVAVVVAACGAHTCPTASPVPCVLRMQAQVSIKNGFGVSQTYCLGGVRNNGIIQGAHGASNCSGNATTFSGNTAPGSGLSDYNYVQMNANWQVAWGFDNTPFSACAYTSISGYVYDSGAVFDDICHP